MRKQATKGIYKEKGERKSWSKSGKESRKNDFLSLKSTTVIILSDSVKNRYTNDEKA
ncbi:hypothetical protein V7056_08570 [Bacillus sp. JJ664]